jgi:hypothetical protein
MTETPPPRRLSKGQIALMAAIDTVAIALGAGLYAWMKPHDPDAAILGLISAFVFAGFFNLVIVLVSLKP